MGVPEPDVSEGEASVDVNSAPSPYRDFDRGTWSALRAATPLTLNEDDVARLRGINDLLDLHEVEQVYLPLSRLLNLRVAASQALFQATDTFLGTPVSKVPFLIGIAGSVAVGKSTTARVLAELLAHWPDHPNVALIPTDNFLHSNAVLAERGIMNRKGFPESYDRAALIDVLGRLKSGARRVTTPVYSHVTYDIVAGRHEEIVDPDIVLVEGLNVLQAPAPETDDPVVFVSDFFDTSLYVDAPEELARRWYIQRFFTLRETVFRDPDSYFANYAALDDDDAAAEAGRIWESINGLNLRENILPTRGRADVILEKGERHRIERVRLRRL